MQAKVTFGEAFWVWVKVAIYSFGEPTGQIAVMHRFLADEKRRVSENRLDRSFRGYRRCGGCHSESGGGAGSPYRWAYVTAGALLAMLRFKVGMIQTLAASALIGLLYHLMLRGGGFR